MRFSRYHRYKRLRVNNQTCLAKRKGIGIAEGTRQLEVRAVRHNNSIVSRKLSPHALRLVLFWVDAANTLCRRKSSPPEIAENGRQRFQRLLDRPVPCIV